MPILVAIFVKLDALYLLEYSDGFSLHLQHRKIAKVKKRAFSTWTTAKNFLSCLHSAQLQLCINFEIVLTLLVKYWKSVTIL